MDPDPRVEIEPMLPRRIGRYEVFLRIAVGGMARLFLGVQHGPFAVKKLVVIKQLLREYSDDPRCLEMFVDEARIALRLNHPNVVHTYEVLAEAPDYYLVMEFLDGHSLLELLERIERPKMPLHEHLWILTQLLAGLHYAHSLRDFDGNAIDIVHCDVSPSNVFVCRSGEVKLLDFGIAKISGSLAPHDRMLRGKLGYLSPEQCAGTPATARSDLYSVGVLLWEAMAKHRRATGQNQNVQLRARIEGTEPAIEQVWPEAPAPLIAICGRALATQPERRYASALEFQRDLEDFLAQERSRAGGASVSQLVRTLFTQEKVVLDRAIEARIGPWEPSAVVTSGRPRSHVPYPMSQVEERTSRIAVDRALLQATRCDLRPVGDSSADFAGSLRSGSALWRKLGTQLRALRGRPAIVLALGAAAGAAAAIWLTSHSRSASTASHDLPPGSTTYRPATSSNPHDAGAKESSDDPPALAEQPAPESAKPGFGAARSVSADETSEPRIGAKTKTRPASPRPESVPGSARTLSASPPAPARPRPQLSDPAAAIEPGSDLLRAPVRKRTRVTLDEEDPYAR